MQFYFTNDIYRAQIPKAMHFNSIVRILVRLYVSLNISVKVKMNTIANKKLNSRYDISTFWFKITYLMLI